MTIFLRKHWLFLAFIIPLTLLLAVFAIYSLKWRNQLDVPYILYMVNLMDTHGLAPYRDIQFDPNMPGTYLLYGLFGRLVGYTNDLGFRLIDLGWLAAILGVTGLWLRQFGWKVAWASITMFGLLYLSSGFWMIMQREYLVLLPLSIVTALVAARYPADQRARAVLVGLGVGLAGSVKPHLTIGFPVLVAFICLDDYPNIAVNRAAVMRWLTILGWSLVGIALPIVAVVIYLAGLGSLDHFYEMLTEFVPLYTSLSYSSTLSSYAVIGPEERPLFVLERFLEFGEISPMWFVAAFAGFVISFLNPLVSSAARLRVALLGSLAIVYALYPAISGQFWPYHWIPLLFFLALLASLCFQHVPDEVNAAVRRTVAAVAVIAVLTDFNILPGISTQLARYYIDHQPLPPPDNGVADRVADFLRSNLQPGDTVQNLEWIQGIAHGMLLADAQPATPYVSYLPLYIHVSSPYSTHLREQFVGALTQSQPRFIIEYGDDPELKGPDTTDTFNELQLLIDARYHIAESDRGLTFYERNPGWSQAAPWTIAAYPFRPGAVAGWFTNQTGLRFQAIRLASTPDDRRAIIGMLSAEPQVVTLVFANTERIDPEQVLESEAAAKLFRISEYQSKLARVVETISAPDECFATETSTITFGDQIALSSQSARLVTLGDDCVVCIRLEWLAESRIASSYKVAAHIIGPDGTLVAQYDSIPRGFLSPTTIWTPGQPVFDQFAIHLPATLPPGTYQIQLVLYDEITLERLLVTSDPSSPDHALLGTFTIAKP